MLNDGRIVILNAGSRQLLFYQSEGNYLRSIGAEGRGPGEFRDPAWLGRAPGDTLLVWDAGLTRLSVFDDAGALLATRQVGFRNGSGVSATLRGRFADGSFLALPGPLVFLTGGERGVLRFAELYQRYDSGTDSVTTLAEGRSVEMVFGDRGGYSLPFGQRGFAVAAGALLLAADNGIPEFRLHDMDGRLRRVVRWVADGVPVTSRDRLSYVESGSSESEREVLGGGPFAAERPKFSAIQVDRTGWIWLQTYSAEWEPSGPWLVFDGEGVLRCEVASPGRISVLDLGTDYLLGLQRDENGEESVARFDVWRAPAARAER